jgi:hypothetical protein
VPPLPDFTLALASFRPFSSGSTRTFVSSASGRANPPQSRRLFTLAPLLHFASAASDETSDPGSLAPYNDRGGR